MKPCSTKPNQNTNDFKNFQNMNIKSLVSLKYMLPQLLNWKLFVTHYYYVAFLSPSNEVKNVLFTFQRSLFLYSSGVLIINKLVRRKQYFFVSNFFFSKYKKKNASNQHKLYAFRSCLWFWSRLCRKKCVSINYLKLA